MKKQERKYKVLVPILVEHNGTTKVLFLDYSENKTYDVNGELVHEEFTNLDYKVNSGENISEIFNEVMSAKEELYKKNEGLIYGTGQLKNEHLSGGVGESEEGDQKELGSEENGEFH